MSERLWRRCPRAVRVVEPHRRHFWRCDCHGDWDKTLLPVAPDAVFAEDRGQAIDRIARKFRRQVEGLGVDMTISGTLSDGTKVSARIPRKAARGKR